MLPPSSAERPNDGASGASPEHARVLPDTQATENRTAAAAERPSVAPQGSPTQQQNESPSLQHDASASNAHDGEEAPADDVRHGANAESDAGQEANLQQTRQQEADRLLWLCVYA